MVSPRKRLFLRKRRSSGATGWWTLWTSPASECPDVSFPPDLTTRRSGWCVLWTPPTMLRELLYTLEWKYLQECSRIRIWSSLGQPDPDLDFENRIHGSGSKKMNRIRNTAILVNLCFKNSYDSETPTLSI